MTSRFSLVVLFALFGCRAGADIPAPPTDVAYSAGYVGAGSQGAGVYGAVAWDRNADPDIDHLHVMERQATSFGVAEYVSLAEIDAIDPYWGVGGASFLVGLGPMSDEDIPMCVTVSASYYDHHDGCEGRTLTTDHTGPVYMRLDSGHSDLSAADCWR